MAKAVVKSETREVFRVKGGTLESSYFCALLAKAEKQGRPINLATTVYCDRSRLHDVVTGEEQEMPTEVALAPLAAKPSKNQDRGS